LKSAGSCTSNSEANPGSPNRGDALEIRLNGREAIGLDRGLVHEGRVEVADLLLGSGGGGVRGGRLLDDGADALLGELIKLVERTEARVVGGNGKGVIPRAVRIGEEVIAGFHADLAGAQVQAKIADDRLDGGGGSGWRGGCDGHRFLLDGF
jgi:hypothetical protein